LVQDVLTNHFNKRRMYQNRCKYS